MDITDITDILIDSIKNQTPFSFSKYGDGEFYCANSHSGCNCDNDMYTNKKRIGLIQSFKYMVDNGPNSYVGFWHDMNHCKFWESLTKNPVKWAKYQSLFLDGEETQKKVELYKTIKESTMKKIYICNPLLEKAKILFNTDYMIHVPLNNWFDTRFNNILEQLKKIIQPDIKYIIMTSAGMGAKILICELTKLFPNNIYLDFGSAIDKICTKRTSRGWEPEYDTFMTLLKDIIPEDWNHSKYEYIYKEADKRLGIHLHR
jgi:hypothetical protein